MEKYIERFIRFIIGRPVHVVAAVLLTAVAAAGWLIAFRPLRLDTNFTTLLPDDLPCVVESRRVSKLVGSTDFLYVAIESPVPADNIAFAEEVASRLQALPYIDWVATKEDKSYFRRHRLLYIDTDDLKEVVRRARVRVDYEKQKANPFYIDLNNASPPDLAFDDIMGKYEDRLARQGIKGILEHGGEKSGTAASGENADMGEDFIANADRTLVTVMARPSKASLDMEFARALVAKTQEIIDASNPKRNPEMKVDVAGSYRNRTKEYDNIVGDIVSSLAASFVLIVLVIIIAFRRFRSLLLIFVPLIVGTIFSVAATALTLGRLNMVTALIFAVLLGLGIDFGVHMTTRYMDERGRGKSLEESLRLALRKTGRAIVVAGLTTAGGLGVLAAARFKGFSEFGIIATMGILICLAVYILLLPSLAALMERVSVPKPRRAGTARAPFVPGKTLPIWIPGLLTVLIAAATGGALYYISDIEFEYDFHKLGSAVKVSSNIKYGKTLSQSSSPVVAVLDTQEQARRVTRHLEEIVESTAQSPERLLRNAFSIFSFVPDDQPTKLALLAELQGYVDQALLLRKLKDGMRAKLEGLREWTEVSTVTIDTLPSWVRGKFLLKDGTIGTMVYLFPSVNEFQVDRMADFYDRFGLIDVPGGKQVRPTASGFIMVEVVRAVQRDGVMMTVVASLIVLLLLFADQRSLKRVALVFFPLLLSLLWTAGIMGGFGIKLGLYNMLVLPLLLGIGVDTSVHFYHAYLEQGAGSIRSVLKTTGMAIFVSSATTAVGFVGMMMVSHNGLRTIGNLAIIGISVTMLGSLLILSTLLALGEARRGTPRGE